MQAYTRSLFHLFDGKRRYVIPLFQRQYVWGEEKQWSPLWEDIESKTLSVLSSTQDDKPPHFLGAVVISLRKTFGNQVQTFEVIDGQQRLTTFQVLFAALRDVATSVASKDLADELRLYTKNSGMMEKPDEEQFKVWPTQSDINQFKDVILTESFNSLEEKYPAPKSKKALSRPAMVAAYIYFHGKLLAFLEEELDAEKKGRRLQAVYDALHKNFQIVSIELEDRDDPQIIFETLNARGEPLLPSDLLRNFVFLRAARSGEAIEGLYKEYWSEFDNLPEDPKHPQGPFFWKVEESQGRYRRARLDLFMHHFLTFKTLEEINIGRLFQEYKDWVNKKNPYGNSVKNELNDLKIFSEAFKEFYRPNPETRLGRFCLRLQELETSTVYPLLLGLLTHSKVELVELNGIITDLESFLIRRLICGRTSKNYNKHFLSILKEVFKLDKITRTNFQKLLTSSTLENLEWPNDAAFGSAWVSTPLYDKIRASRIEMILRAIEMELQTTKREKITIHNKLTIEHVLPQDWQEHWPLPEGLDQGDRGAMDVFFDGRCSLLHTIGNLTLLTNSLNPSIGNGPYSLKRPEITKQSALRLNSYFQDVKDWNEQAIGQRSFALLEMAKRIWPYPG